jgi:hypothetical protein
MRHSMLHTWTMSTAGLAILATVSACATNEVRQEGSPAIAIRRGSAWATYTFKMPRIVGPTAELQLDGGHLRGIVASRSMDIRIGTAQATGFGPRGPVSLNIAQRDGRIELDGMWNAGPVHFVFTELVVRGSVVVRSGQTAAQEISCSYQLDRRESTGALVGFSTCAGMPQEARLEVDEALREVLSPNELAVFLVAALASPPFAPYEWR